MAYNGDGCLWCQDPEQARPLLGSLCDQLQPTWLPHMLEDLGSCFDCVVEYQRAKEDFLEVHPEMKQPFYEFDVKRISEYLESQMSSNLQLSDDVIDVDGYVTVADRLRTPLLECLKYPNYLMHTRINEVFIRALQLHSDRGEDLLVDEKLPGAYLLIIHPHHLIRRWAIKTVCALGAIAVNDFDDLQLVSKWIISVPKFGLICHSAVLELTDTFLPWDPEATLVLPNHLFDSQQPHDFWVGFCMFLTALDAQTLKTLLITDQQEIVDIIVNVFDDKHDLMVTESSAFWPALQCFVVILQRTESRLWSVSSQNPNSVLNLVIYNRHYQAELLALASYTDNMEDEDEIAVVAGDMSNSQIAFEWDGKSAKCQKRDISQRSFHATLFGWFTAFVLSLVDFGDLAADQFKYVVRFLLRMPDRLIVNNNENRGGALQEVL
ncbi:probable helicase senataxin [Corticium candelabrum]|uniref:probable helicase senataxin n=1 Tax=Corticium candelabrum TaxID=121492 RepID=UPI002E32415E|nr:probable helicase senataxin [Corticium candelabrum]